MQVCVFTAPLFSALCALATYGLVRECRSPGAGLAAAALVAVVPSYISRSVAGSYDNEGVAIFALVNVFFTFIKVGGSWGNLGVGEGRDMLASIEVSAGCHARVQEPRCRDGCRCAGGCGAQLHPPQWGRCV